MQLAFDENGNILNEAGKLSDVALTLQGEFYRLNSFFGIKRGLYKFDTKFGHQHNKIVGKANVTYNQLTKFVKTLTNDFVTSGILLNTNYNIEFQMTSRQSVQFTLTTTENQTSFIWDFNIKNGKLNKVDNLSIIPDSQTFDIVTEVFTSDGRSSFNLEDLYSNMLSKNNISIYNNYDTQHRIYAQAKESPTKRIVSTNEYDINLLDFILKFYINPPEGHLITVEMWPTPMVNLSVSTNPYILRKQ